MQIDSEEALFEQSLRILMEYKKEVEVTRLWSPFWNERPMNPKRETSLQPTIFSRLRPTFRHLGIEFLAEPDDGAGPLDFRCTATHNNNVFNCCIEFKKAQHPNLEGKIQKQLPSYMDAADTRHGVFLVFWFRDDVHCNEPKKYPNPDILRKSLLDASEKDVTRKIEVIVIDVTKKPSASKK